MKFPIQYNSQEKIWKDESKIANKSKNRQSNSNLNDHLRKKEIEEHLDNLNINKKIEKIKEPDKTKNNKITKTTDIFTLNPNILNFEEGKDNNHFLNKKRTNKKRPKHDKKKLIIYIKK